MRQHRDTTPCHDAARYPAGHRTAVRITQGTRCPPRTAGGGVAAASPGRWAAGDANPPQSLGTRALPRLVGQVLSMEPVRFLTLSVGTMPGEDGGRGGRSEQGLGASEAPCKGQQSREGFGRAGVAKHGPGDLQWAWLPMPLPPVPGGRTSGGRLLHAAEEPGDIRNPLNKYGDNV